MALGTGHNGHVACSPWGCCIQTRTCSPKAMGEGPCGGSGLLCRQLPAGALPAVSTPAAAPGNGCPRGSGPRLSPSPCRRSTLLLARERLSTHPGLMGPEQAVCVRKTSCLWAQASLLTVDHIQEECMRVPVCTRVHIYTYVYIRVCVIAG